MGLSKSIGLLLLAVLFLGGLVAISYGHWYLGTAALGLLAIAGFADARFRFVASLYFGVLASFLIYWLVSAHIAQYDLTKPWRIIIHRGLLGLILVGVYAVHAACKRPPSPVWRAPNWQQPIVLPFHQVRLSIFLLVGILIYGIAFLPFIFQKSPAELQALLLFGLLFSMVNAVLEEWIWRGPLLSSLENEGGYLYALVVTSLGFGLLHISIGFSFGVSLLFAGGGLFYGIAALQSRSLYPAILLHVAINLGMVFSGMIL